MTFPDGPPLQAFTLIDRIFDTAPFQHTVVGNLTWRRPALWQESRMTPIRPLLDQLDLARGLKSWGLAFGYGSTRLSYADSDRIARGMGVQNGRTQMPS